VLGNFKGWEILVIIALILLLFGAKRLPDAARGLGRSMRIFKAETKGLAGEADASAAGTSAPATPASPAPVGPAQPAATGTSPVEQAPAPQPERTENA
jgi:sec-independent protein translocase protein TatA